MKLSLRSAGFVACLLSLPILIVASSRSQPSHVFLLEVAGDGDAKAIAGRVMQGIGTVEGRDPSGAFVAKLSPGQDLQKVLEKLRSRREVSAAYVRGAEPPLRLDSRESIREFIEEKEESLGGEKGHSEEDKEKLGLDYLESLEYRLRHRAFPYDKVDWDAYEKARVRANNLPPARIGGGTRSSSEVSAFGALAGKWEFIGPSNLDVPYRIYYGVRPTSGRVNAIAYDPKNPKTVYIGGANGGIWRTIDDGKTWTPLGDKWDFMYVSSIAVDPVNPKNVYVGTGDWHGGGGYGIGVMKSTDGGASWTNLGRTQLSGVAISRVLVDPDTPSIVTITTGRGRDFNGRVYRSTDSGQTWTTVITTSAPWSDAAISARSASGTRYYYAVGGGDGGNVWRSADRGATWTKLTANVGTGSLGNLGIAASPVDSERAYILGADSQKIYKTTDHGGTWTDSTGNFPGGYNWSQAWYDFHITCSSSGSNDVVYVGLIDIVQSLDSGANWRSIGVSYTDSAATHNDQHSMAINPANPNEAYFGNDGGIYKLAVSGTTNTITPLSKTLGISQFYYADWHPTNPSIVIGGTQDNATPTSQGDLANWKNVGGGDGGWCLINPLKPATQYATSQFLGMYRTDNSWVSSRFIAPDTGGDNLAFIPTIAIDPVNPNNVYAGTNFLWRYNAGSDNWTPRLGGTALSRSYVLTITVSGQDNKVIYTGGADGELYMTVNSGTTWKRLNGVPARAITGISIDPANSKSILVTVGGTGTGHVYQCTNTVATTPVFTNRTGVGGVALPDVHTTAVERDPAKPQSTWYVGTDIGVFATTNGGTSWENATAPLGLPNTSISTLKANRATGYLNAATYGRGMWRIKLGTETTLVPLSFTVHSGSVTSGNTDALARVDSNVMTIRSANMSGIGQVAGIQANFTSSIAKTNMLGLEIFVRSSGDNVSTEQVFVKNQTTGQFDNVRNEASAASYRDFRFSLSGTGADYVAANGKVEVIVRSIKPTRLGADAITYRIDCVNVVVRAAG